MKEKLNMSLQKKFEEFNTNIHLTRDNTDYRNAREKDDSITDAIKVRFKEEGYPVIDNFIQGSLSTFTTIKPIDEDFDIDRAIVISEENAPKNPLTPKNIVLEILEKRGFKNAKIKKPCVTADYQSIDLHIDIPIYSRDENDNYKLAVGKSNSTKEWSASDPKGLINWINNFDSYPSYKSEHRNQFRRLVRYIKKWRNERFSDDIKSKLFSIGLTIMIKECFHPSIDNDGIPNDLSALKNTISFILSSGKYLISDNNGGYKIRVYLPVSPYLDIYNDAGSSVRGTQFYNKLSTLRNKLEDAIEAEGNLKKQCEILNTQFGDDFPIIEEHNEKRASIGFVTAGTVGTSQGA